MSGERNKHTPQDATGAERLADLASRQVVRNVALEKDNDTILPESRELTEEEKQADVIPEDFDSFNLDAVSKLEQTKENPVEPEES